MTMISAGDVVHTLLTAVQKVRLYGGNHPAAREATEQFFRTVKAELEQAPVLIEIDERTVMVQAVPQPAEGYVTQLRTHLAARRVGGLTLQQDADMEAVAAVVRLLAREPEELLAEGGVADALRAAGIASIAVQALAPASERPAARAQDPYAVAVRAVHDITTATEAGQPVDMPQALLAVAGLAAALVTEPPYLWQRLADRGHDELDPAHAVDTCLLTLYAGEAFGLPQQVAVELGVAALLHDIGLAALPWEERIQERVTVGVRPEWRHPFMGAFLLRHLGGRESLPMIVAAEHHRPALGQTPVLPQTNLVALADYLDATTCGRVPAARQTSMGAALDQLLSGSGPRFDPTQVRMLADVIRRQEVAGLEFTAPV